MKTTTAPDCTCSCGHRHKSVTGSLSLEPCPFCGDNAEFGSNADDEWYVACTYNVCVAGDDFSEERATCRTPRLAAAAWNKACRAAKRRKPILDKNGLLPCACGAAAEIDDSVRADWGVSRVVCSDPDCPFNAYIQDPWADDDELTFESIVDQWNARDFALPLVVSG